MRKAGWASVPAGRRGIPASCTCRSGGNNRWPVTGCNATLVRQLVVPATRFRRCGSCARLTSRRRYRPRRCGNPVPTRAAYISPRRACFLLPASCIRPDPRVTCFNPVAGGNSLHASSRFPGGARSSVVGVPAHCSLKRHDALAAGTRAAREEGCCLHPLAHHSAFPPPRIAPESLDPRRGDAPGAGEGAAMVGPSRARHGLDFR